MSRPRRLARLLLPLVCIPVGAGVQEHSPAHAAGRHPPRAVDDGPVGLGPARHAADDLPGSSPGPCATRSASTTPRRSRRSSPRANVNAVNAAGETPLHLAAREGMKDGAELIRHGARVGEAASDGATPLHRAAMAKDDGAARVLLDAGAT